MTLHIHRRLALLERELNSWARLLASVPPRRVQHTVDEVMAYPLLQDGDDVELTLGFALEEVVALTGRLKTMTDAAVHLWPHRSDEFRSLGARLSLPQLNPAWAERLAGDGELAIRVLRAETILPVETVEQAVVTTAPDEYARFSEFCDFRRFTAKLAVLEAAGMYGALVHDAWLRPVSGESLSPDQNAQLQGHCRAYLAAEHLFPWVEYRVSEPAQWCYRAMFEFAGIGRSAHVAEKGLHMIHRPWQEALEGEFAEQIRQIIGRLYEALQQLGDYGDLVSQVLDAGGQWGPDSMVGSSKPVNIIPATDAAGECREAVVALAQGRRGPRGLKSVLRQVREHLIRCGNAKGHAAEPTRVVILVTDVWDPEVLAESMGDFAAHAQAPFMPKTFVGVLVNGTQISIQQIV